VKQTMNGAWPAFDSDN